MSGRSRANNNRKYNREVKFAKSRVRVLRFETPGGDPEGVVYREGTGITLNDELPITRDGNGDIMDALKPHFDSAIGRDVRYVIQYLLNDEWVECHQDPRPTPVY